MLCYGILGIAGSLGLDAMIGMSLEGDPMKQFRATYRHQGKDRNLDMFARDLTHATLSAKELIPVGSRLVTVFHNPDWN